MWLVRGIGGLLLIGLAVMSLPPLMRALFLEPIGAPRKVVDVLFTAGLFVLGLWVMGGRTAVLKLVSPVLSVAAQKRIRERAMQDELQARASKWFALRNRLMGLVALVFGLAVLAGILIAEDWREWRAFTGACLFIACGVWYLIRGRDAESRTPAP
jgi:hypothetical protein